MICTSLTIAPLCKRLTSIVNDVQKAGNHKNQGEYEIYGIK